MKARDVRAVERLFDKLAVKNEILAGTLVQIIKDNVSSFLQIGVIRAFKVTVSNYWRRLYDDSLAVDFTLFEKSGIERLLKAMTAVTGA